MKVIEKKIKIRQEKEIQDLIKESSNEIEELYKERNERLYNLTVEYNNLINDNQLIEQDIELDKYKEKLDILLSTMKEYQFKTQTTSKDWFNIDTSSARNAEYKDGVPYNFGELRKIKEIA